MSRRKRATPAKAITALCDRIEHWRMTRTRRSPMPEKLWQAATRLAQVHGVGPVSRQLRVGYATLRKRLADTDSEPAQVQADEHGFVELSAAQLLGGSAATGAVVELTADDGSRMTVRLDHSSGLDVPGLVASFLGRRP